MSFRNIKKMKYLALFVAILAVGAISSGDANAASTFDTYTDGDGVVWDRETTDDGDIYIGIHSVPANVTTVTVPAIGDVASGKDTYFLDAVCSDTSSCASVISDTATVTVLDMTNASKIQIRNVSQMFNAAHEVELKFGANVVIADPAEISNPSYWQYPSSVNPYASYPGAFEGMKVKLTDLSNVKYIGWNAFKDTALNAASKDITINNNQTIGGYVFAGSDITGLSIDAAEIGQGFCKGCTSLASLTIGDNVTSLRASAFEGTTSLSQVFNSNNITEIGGQAFKGSGITSANLSKVTYVSYEAFLNTTLSGGATFGTAGCGVGPAAFQNAGLVSIDLTNISSIEREGFKGNNITEVYFPKTYRKWEDLNGNTVVDLFENNPLKKVTLAYDLTAVKSQGSYTQPFWNQIGANAFHSIEEIVLIAPYGADEAVAADHGYNFINSDSGYMSLPNDVIYSLKNIIPRDFFEVAGGINGTGNTKKIVIDDNYEMIGSNAFQWLHINGIYTINNGVVSEDMRFPSKLRVIGSNAFGYSSSDKAALLALRINIDSLPQTLEYIGEYAFVENRSLLLNNFNLPNLVYLGGWAFDHVYGVKNIVLHDFDYYRTSSMLMFYGDENIETVVVDYDFFGQKYKYGSSGFSGMFSGWYAYYYSEALALNAQHFTSVKFTSKAVTAPSSNSYLDLFQGIWTDELDLSETPWTALYGDGQEAAVVFREAKIGTLKLPSNLEYINPAACIGADIDNLVLPATVKTIGEQAFSAVSSRLDRNSAEFAIGRYNAAHAEDPGFVPFEFNVGVKITSLPSSIESIGANAFYNDTKFTADVDLPNLKNLGASAFAGSGAHDVYLHDGLESLGINAFYGATNLNDITIDVDLYDADIRNGYDVDFAQLIDEGIIDSVSDLYGEHYDAALTGAENYDADYYDSFVATFGTPDHEYGTITFTENAGQPCEGHYNCSKDRAYFYGLKADKVDLSATNWQSTGESMFQESEIGELILPSGLVNIANDTFYQVALGDVTIPSTLQFIQQEAFQWATANIDGLPEGLILINSSAFYGADVTDNLVIPSTVQNIGQDAFNAGDEDVHYDTITIKPSLSSSQTNNQLIFQIFWNVDVDKMTIASFGLPAGTSIPEGETKPEFHGMPMEEVVITNLPVITKEAFEDCVNLKKVDLSSDANLRVIDKKAFVNDAELDTILFSPDIKNIDVTIGQYAFEGTAFKTMGDNTKQFDLTAAKFDASDGFAFSKMPLLETVDVPATFSELTVPEATFANDPELRLVTIDYHLDTIDNAAFSNDNKLESIFIWGDTQVIDENIAGRGGDGDGIGGAGGSGPQAVGPEYGPTIPEPTDIYAYSTSRAEEYAALPVRGTFEGDFYPLDEVLYLTSNKPTVLLNDDETDFDKSDLVVYAMRRDGIILESDEWSTYDGNAYPRSTSSVDFEHMAEKIQEDPVFGSIHDTPVPMNELDVTTNVNFANIDFALVPTEENPNVKKVTLLYNDKYTDNLADTDILPYQEKEDDDEEPAVPDTGAAKAMATFTKAALPIVAIVSLSLLGGVIVFKKRKN